LTTEVQEKAGLIERYLEGAVRKQQVDLAAVIKRARKAGLDIRGRSRAQQLTSIRELPLEQRDKLAESWVRRFATEGAAVGGATGSFGLLGLSANVKRELTLTLRMTSAVMLSYGHDPRGSSGEAELWVGLAEAFGAKAPHAKAVRSQLVKSTSRRAVLRAGSEARRAIALAAARTAATHAPTRAIPGISAVLSAGGTANSLYQRGRRAKKHFRAYH
jgi:hypothetical protein